MGYVAYCVKCRAQQSRQALVCGVCGGCLGFLYDNDWLPDDAIKGSMWRYWRLLPVDKIEDIVTLGEGGTPLIPSRRSRAGQVWFKDETRNPTGSHKDRALALAVSHGRALGWKASVVVSGGSTGISNAAAAARAGMEPVVVVTGDVVEPRLYPLWALGAKVIVTEADLDSVVECVGELGAAGKIYVSSTARRSNPYQAEGPKTISYEIGEGLVSPPDWVVVPVGGGGTVAGIWRGFEDMVRMGVLDRAPRLLGVVAEGYNAIDVCMKSGSIDPNEVFENGYVPPPTLLVKLANVRPPDGAEALNALRASGGVALSVTDGEALNAQYALGRTEGLYVEPSSAAAVAGFEKACEAGVIEPDATVVVVLSGSGFRESFASGPMQPRERLHAKLEALPDLLLAL